MTDSTTDPAAAPAAGATAVDGVDGTAEPLCMSDPGNPACARRMIAVAELTAHPGNVREDLDLTAEFCASVAGNGVRVPLLITTGADGGYRVIEGHRRLAAAVKAGLAEVPYDLDSQRAADEAGQFLDMVTANSAAYRKNFTPLQEATALFAAHEAGATRTRIRKATGRNPGQVKTALAAGGLTTSTREQVGGLDRQLTLDELALLAEFENDPDAIEQLLVAVASGYPLEHVAERIRQQRAEKAGHQRVRAELAASGCHISDQIVPGSSLLTSLAHDGQDLTPQTHKDCPGHGAFFRSHDLRTPVFYCTGPAAHGHTSRWAQPAPLTPFTRAVAPDSDQRPSAQDTGSAAGFPAARPVPEPTPDPAVEQARRRVIEGNRAWAAAAEVRKRWVAQLLWRRTAPKEVLRFTAGQLLTMPDALRRGLPAAAGRLVFIELTGKPLEAVLRDCETYPLARLPLLVLAPIAIAYESEMAGDGDRKSTWRTDTWAPCSRKDAGRWLMFLASLGYPMSAIEQAVARGVPYEGQDPAGEPDTGPTGTPDGSATDADPAAAASGQVGSDPDHQADPGQAEAGADPAGTASGQVATDAVQASDGVGSTADEASRTDDRGEDPRQAVA
jgi:ParB family chromosome partitioning protein